MGSRAPAFAQPEPGQTGHQVHLRKPGVTGIPTGYNFAPLWLITMLCE